MAVVEFKRPAVSANNRNTATDEAILAAFRAGFMISCEDYNRYMRDNEEYVETHAQEYLSMTRR